jgi:hypothetical protein
MTELLKDMMNDRADSLGAPDLDVLGMVREGNRRVARRRTAVLSAGVAAVVVAAIAVPTLLRDAPKRATEVSFAAAFTAHEPSYAIGSEVHIDGRTFDVGHPVHAFVQTTAGVVFTDKAGTVWASDGSRTVEVGNTEAKYPHLEADGPRVAWTTYRDGAAPEYTVYDQSTGEILSTPFDTGNDGPTEYDDALFAVDGVDVYFRDSRGIVRWNVESGEQTSLGRPHGLEVQDVKSGMLAQRVVDPDEGTTTVYFGRDFLDVGTALWSTLALSPDGRWALGEESSDTPALADTADGSFFSIDVPGYDFFVGYGWVDSETYFGLGLNQPWESTPADLLECEVGGACTVTGSAVGSIDAGLTIPIGEQMDG